MLQHCTQKAIISIMLAQEEGRRLGYNYVDTEQLLLGLIGEGKGIAAKFLEASGIGLKQARDEVQARIGKGNDFAELRWYQRWPILSIFSKHPGEVPFKPRAKKTLELSWTVSSELKHSSIGTEHLLLGLIREARDSLETDGTEGVAVQILQALGIDLIVLQEKILELIKHGEQH
jgi:ATP-dependent Clp protease ATP-binding subunit ClpC